MIHENAPDDLRTEREEVHAAFAPDASGAKQLEIGLIAHAADSSEWPAARRPSCRLAIRRNSGYTAETRGCKASSSPSPQASINLLISADGSPVTTSTISQKLIEGHDTFSQPFPE